MHPKNKAKQLFITMNFKILCTVYIYVVQLVLSLEKLSINSCFALFLGCNILSALFGAKNIRRLYSTCDIEHLKGEIRLQSISQQYEN